MQEESVDKLLTICIPVRNDSSALVSTLLSLEEAGAGEHVLVEVIISDNASTDNSFVVADTFCRQFQNWKSFAQNENLGFAGNLKFLFDESSGKYVWTLGAGDCLMPYAMEDVIDLLTDSDFKWGTVMGLFNFQNYKEYQTKPPLLRVGSLAKRNVVPVFNHAVGLNIMSSHIAKALLQTKSDFRKDNESGRLTNLNKTDIWEGEMKYWPHLELIKNFLVENSQSDHKWFEYRKLAVVLDTNKNGSWDRGFSAFKVYRQWSEIVSASRRACPNSIWLKRLDISLRNSHLLRFTFLIRKDENLSIKDVMATIRFLSINPLVKLGVFIIMSLPRFIVDSLIYFRRAKQIN
jgi:glycosyltransferase involved in cell wall biosynthesis